jgi:hypothetical protein
MLRIFSDRIIWASVARLCGLGQAVNNDLGMLEQWNFGILGLVDLDLFLSVTPSHINGPRIKHYSYGAGKSDTGDN